MIPTIRQRWDETRGSRIGKRINTERLIRKATRRRQKSNKAQHISPAAPSTISLFLAETQHRRFFTPYPCDVCKRDRSAYSGGRTASTASAAAPALPLDDTFSLSDACPQMGGAHGYVDLLKGTEIALAHWPHFARALADAGVVASWLTTRDRLVAYVLWEAMMAPERPGLGFAPGVARGGGSLLFLDMRDPLRRPIEVHLFDFLRVLQDRMAAREGHEVTGGEEEEEEEKKIRPVTPMSGGLEEPSDSYLDFISIPPLDPIQQRYSWCKHSGFLDIGNPYRRPEYRSLLDAQWPVSALRVAFVERQHAARAQWERERALAEARDKEKGKGRLVDVEPPEHDDNDERYYAAAEAEDSDESDDSDSDVGSGCSVRHGAQYWSNTLMGLFGSEQAPSAGDGDEAHGSERESVVKTFWSSIDFLGGGDGP